MRRTFLLIAIAIGTSWNVVSQPATSPAFEVASLKPNPDGRGRQLLQISQTSISIKKANLQFLISWAYNLRRDQVVCPLWFKTELYDIVAKAAEPSSEDGFRLMLQNLLAERFKLAFHRETKAMSVYEMVVAKGGPKLVESKITENVYPRVVPSSYQLPHTSMEELARLLEEFGAVSLPVANRTGIPGFFDITLTIPERSRLTDRETPGSTSIFSALEQQLGLKLDERKAPAEIVVIDHAERVPIEN